jgi:transposase
MVRGKSLSKDLRLSIITAHNKGMSGRKISISHTIPRSTVQDIINLYEKTGKVEERKKTGRPSTITYANKRALRKIIKTSRRSNVKDITVLWRDAIKKDVSLSTTKRTIRKIGYKFYKVNIIC